MREKKSVLVTGGCGYIGSHVTRQLSESGYAVTVIDNLRTGFADALLHQETLIVGDVGDTAMVRKTLASRSFVAVLHFAGSVVVPDSVADPLAYFENNVVQSFRLLEACVEAKLPRFIFSSTGSLYGENSGGLLGEDAPTAPTNPYSRSKLMFEWMLRDVAAATDLRYLALRYFNVAGAEPGGRLGQRTAGATHLIKVASEAAVGKRAGMTIFGDDFPTPDGTGVRDYIHVEDLASAHLSALRYLENGGASTVLNCGYGKGYSVREVVAEVQRTSGVKFAVQLAPRREGDASSYVADPAKLRRTLDWQPKYADLAEIARSAVAWEKK